MTERDHLINKEIKIYFTRKRLRKASVLLVGLHVAMPSEIFVFGSNLKGIHGAGAAKYAREHYGAEMGWFNGPTGNAYAIPTKNSPYDSLPLPVIENYVKDFLIYATEHQELYFKVTRIGCGLAGYSDKDIAPMFRKGSIEIANNCEFDSEWLFWLCNTDCSVKFFDMKNGMKFLARKRY